MRKTVMAVAAAASLASATLVAPTQANAAWWVVPAIVFGTVGAVTLGAAVAQPYLDPRLPAAAYPQGTVSVRPMNDCYITRQRIEGRMRRVEVCR